MAILPVVLYHYRIPGFSGGYVGVDIFFVISGYLISSLIYPQVVAGEFSIVEFYERRVRRLAPALLGVLVGTFILSYFLLFPIDFVQYSKSTIATTLFVSNVFFDRQTGYFAASSYTEPLLHTWSLAVEEQFYIIFPLTLMLCRRISRNGVVTFLIGAGIASLAIAGVLPDNHAFFLSPARGWELALGAILAISGWHSPRSDAMREVLAVLGAAMVIVPVLTYSPTAQSFPFPGALVPCVGATLLIWCGVDRSTKLGQVLSFPTVVFIGNISYSLYLWHWPVYAFARYVSIYGVSYTDRAVCIAISLVLAILSWRYIEKPFRGKHGLFRRRELFEVAASAGLAITALSIAVVFAGGGPGRFLPDVRRIAAEQEDINPMRDQCFDISWSRVGAGDFCHFGAQHEVPDFILWGDSIADAVMPGVAEVARRDGRGGIFAGLSGCLPLLNVATDAVRGCGAFNDAALKVALKSNVHQVILMGLWGLGAESRPYKPMGLAEAPESRWILSDHDESGPDADGTNHTVFARGLDRTVAVLTKSGKQVIIVASVPEIGLPVPLTLATIARYHLNADIRTSPAEFRQRVKFAFDQFEAMHWKYGATVLYPSEVMCSETACDIAVKGVPLYFDSLHLSALGADYISPIFDRVFYHSAALSSINR